jgi:hypothetical protein
MTPEQANDADAPQAPAAEPLDGVLAALPRTRPQRASPRRAAARAQAQSETAEAAPARGEGAKTQAKTKPRSKPTKPKAAARTKPKPATPKAATPKATAKKKPAKRRTPAPVAERAPKQGYEPEEEVELGNTVHPPSGGELIESLADIAGELVGAGAGAGGRLLKDALSIFRRP